MKQKIICYLSSYREDQEKNTTIDHIKLLSVSPSSSFSFTIICDDFSSLQIEILKRVHTDFKETLLLRVADFI